jgi:hypothetical protein
VRHHDVQAVGGAALEDHHQPPGAASSFNRSERSAGQERWHCSRAYNGKNAITKKYAACDGHKTAPSF